MLAKALQGGTSAAKTYVDDVFSTFLYTGTGSTAGSTQTITNGIDLAGKGGMVWIKDRGIKDHFLFDTNRGAWKYLRSNTTDAEPGVNEDALSAFNSNGFTLTGDNNVTQNGQIYTSWTFRKAPKFFDVVTYTGNGTSQTISHSLGQVPGCIIVKRTNTTGGWYVYHRSLGADKELLLNQTTAAATDLSDWNNTSPTASVFSVGATSGTNANGGTYVAYLFAHDTTADGLIQCGSYTGTGTIPQSINLGWEPQFVLVKSATVAGTEWMQFDSMRGIATGGNDPVLCPNTSGAEDSVAGAANWIDLTSTGFNVVINNNRVVANTQTYIYIAIRRPNKPPTSGTQVFQPTVYTGTNVDNRLVDTTIAPDMVWVRQRDDATVAGMVIGDRLRGQPYFLTGTSVAEVNDADAFDQQIVSTTEYGTAFSAMNGFWCGNDITAKLNANTTSNNHIAEAFKRAPGFFDVVGYAGTGSTQTINHGLSVVPEFLIVKSRGTGAATVYNGSLGATQSLTLNNSGPANTASTPWNNTAPTTTVFTVGTAAGTNSSGSNYIAYLFASLPGISKVGSYTGNGGTVNTNGTSQTINCGFSAGARFVLIKRTDDTGDWYVFDSARGIVAGNDPYLLTNSTAAEVTTVDAVDADNSGFIVNQTSGTNLNVTNATYIYLAIA